MPIIPVAHNFYKINADIGYLLFSAGSRSSTIEQTDPCHLMPSPCLETFPYFALILFFYETSMTDYPVLSLFDTSKKGMVPTKNELVIKMVS